MWRGSSRRGVTERRVFASACQYRVFASACQYVVHLRGRTGNRAVTKMRHPLLIVQGPLNGRVSNGGLPDLDLSFLFCPFLSFLGLSRFFLDFPDLLGDGPGIFPICPFPLSRPIKSTYEEQSRKGPRHNLDLSRKKWETPGFGNPPV